MVAVGAVGSAREGERAEAALPLTRCPSLADIKEACGAAIEAAQQRVEVAGLRARITQLEAEVAAARAAELV